MEVCPCRLMDESAISYEDCCGPYLQSHKKPSTAESLMRARYSAYAKAQMDFLEKTHLDGRGDRFDAGEALRWAKESEWKGLQVREVKNGQEQDKSGIVTFTAFYKDKKSDKDLEHKEKAHFEKINGDWKFIDGNIEGAGPIKRLEPKIGRNDPCSCGSGKKFKKCCG